MKWSLATIALVPRDIQSELPSAEERLRVFKWAAEAGFGGVELSPRWIDLFGMRPTEISCVRSQVARAGLKVSGLNIDRVIPVIVSEARLNQSRLIHAIALAAELGADVLNFSMSGPVGSVLQNVSSGDFAAAVRFVAILAQTADRSGVRLVAELHDNSLLSTAEACLRLLEEVDHPHLSLNPDLGNFCRNSKNPEDWPRILELLAPHAGCWHVKNYREGELVSLADGVIDYPRAVTMMLASGFEGWVSIEGYSSDYQYTQLRDLSYLKTLWAAS